MHVIGHVQIQSSTGIKGLTLIARSRFRLDLPSIELLDPQMTAHNTNYPHQRLLHHVEPMRLVDRRHYSYSWLKSEERCSLLIGTSRLCPSPVPFNSSLLHAVSS